MLNSIDDFKVGGLYICKRKEQSCILLCLNDKFSSRASDNVPTLILEIVTKPREVSGEENSIRCKVLVKDTMYLLWMWAGSYEKL